MTLANEKCTELRSYICKRRMQGRFAPVTRRWNAKISPDVIVHGQYTLKEDKNLKRIVELTGFYGLKNQPLLNKTEKFQLIFAIENNQNQTQLISNTQKNGTWSYKSGTSLCLLDHSDCI